MSSIVHAGDTHARFVLDSSEDTADLDLLLYTADASGQPDELVGAAATGSADEQLDVEAPEAGSYVLLVDFYSGAGDLGYSLDSLDVAYSGQDPRDAHASARGQGAAAGDEPGTDGSAAGITSSITPAGDAGRLDLLA